MNLLKIHKIYLLGYLFLLTILLAYNTVLSPNKIVSVSALLYFFILACIILAYLNKSNLFNPIYVYCILQITIFLPSWFFFTENAVLENDTYGAIRGKELDALIFKYNLLHVLYILSFYFVFEMLNRKKYKKNIFQDIDRNQIVIIAYIILFISLTSFIVFASNFESIFEMLSQRDLQRNDRVVSKIGRVSAFFSQLITLSTILIILSDKNFLGSKKFWFIFTLNLIIIYLVSGNRTSLALSFLMIFAGQFYHGARIFSVKFIFVAILSIIVLGSANNLRQNGFNSFVKSEHSLSSTLGFESIKKIIDVRKQRSVNGNAGLGVLSYLESNDFIYGETYISIPYIFIPSSLIGFEKPPAAGKYTAKLLAERDNTAWPIGPVIESYLNFGIFGVIFNGILYGVICFFIYKLVINNSHDPIIVAIYFVFVLFFSLGSDGLYKSLPLLLFLFTIFMIFRFRAFR